MKCHRCGRVLNFWSAAGLCGACTAVGAKPGWFTAAGGLLARLRRGVRQRVALPQMHFSRSGLAVLAGWVAILAWGNCLGQGNFAGYVGFPLAYETWTCEEFFPREYPWAMAIDVAFAVCSLILIASLVCRQPARRVHHADPAPGKGRKDVGGAKGK